MKQALVYVLFGDQSHPDSRVHKILKEVRRAATWADKLSQPVAYVYGEDNFAVVKDLGLEARLLDPRPLIHRDPARPQRPAWVHKPLGWAAALSEFDEIVALDWDIRPAARIDLPALFARLGQKSFLQANLLQYRRIKAAWRKGMAGSIPNPPIRMIPSAAFVYLRGNDGRHAVQRTLDLMEALPELSEERALARFVDEFYGGWKGLENWWQHHEPYCCKLRSRHKAVSRGGRISRDKQPLFLY